MEVIERMAKIIKIHISYHGTSARESQDDLLFCHQDFLSIDIERRIRCRRSNPNNSKSTDDNQKSWNNNFQQDLRHARGLSSCSLLGGTDVVTTPGAKRISRHEEEGRKGILPRINQ